jgi:hypothetical protein
MEAMANREPMFFLEMEAMANRKPMLFDSDGANL